MRHKKLKHQLNRFTSWRKATLNSLARSILISQSIKTTKHKALAVKPLVENLISLGKENTLAAKRRAFEILSDHKLVSVLFSDIAPRFAKRAGGYTRMFNLGKRRGDNAEVVIFELTEIKKKEVKQPKKKETETKAHEHEEAHVHEEHKSAPAEALKHDEKSKAQQAKPEKKFLKNIKNIFKKERDSL